MVNEANEDAHYRDRPLGWHTKVVVMGWILIPVINLATDHSEVCLKSWQGGAIKTQNQQ